MNSCENLHGNNVTYLNSNRLINEQINFKSDAYTILSCAYIHFLRQGTVKEMRSNPNSDKVWCILNHMLCAMFICARVFMLET